MWLPDSLRAEVSAEELPLSLIAPMVAVEKPISGTVSVSCQLSGTIDNPLIGLTISAIKPSYDRFALERCTVHTTLEDSLVQTDATILLSFSDSLRIRGTLPVLPSASYRPDTGGSRPCSLSVFGDHIPVNLFAFFLDSGWRVDGTVSMDAAAHLRDNRLVLDGGAGISHGAVENSLLRIAVAGIEAAASFEGSCPEPAASFGISAAPIRVAGETIDRFRCTGNVDLHRLLLSTGELIIRDSGRVALTGHVPFSSNADSMSHIDYEIVHLPLVLISPFLSGIMVQNGTVQGRGSIGFGKGVPEVYGSLSVSGATGQLEEIEPRRIGPVSVSVELAGDSVMIRNLDAVWGKGTCTAGGTIILRSDSLPSVTATCHASGIALSLPEVFDATIDLADMTLSTVDDRYQVEGTVRAGQCRYTQDIQINDLLAGFRTSSYTPPATAADSINRKVRLNIGVDLQDNVALDMNLGYLKIGGTLQLTGSFAEPSYTGELRLTEGYIYYLDRKFTVERAVLTNYNPNELNPGIDIEASAQVTAVSAEQMEYYTIQLTVSGNMENPVVTLQEKSGALNQLEIVSILTFGQLTGGMNGDVRERLRTFASQSVLGFGTRKLEQALGIEKIEFQGDVFGGKDAAAASRVSIAKRVTPRLTVLYETEIGALDKPKISALFRIVKNVFLSGERTSDGDAGIDLIFKYSK